MKRHKHWYFLLCIETPQSSSTCCCTRHSQAKVV